MNSSFLRISATVKEPKYFFGGYVRPRTYKRFTSLGSYPLMCGLLLEVLIVLPVRPSATPSPSMAFELAYYETIFQDGARKPFGPVEILASGRRQHFVAFNIR